MATALKKVRHRKVFAEIGATCKRYPLTNPTFVGFAKLGSSPEMHVSTMMDTFFNAVTMQTVNGIGRNAKTLKLHIEVACAH